jgi:16S rRNA (cytosine967-C5)-methyltransferase
MVVRYGANMSKPKKPSRPRGDEATAAGRRSAEHATSRLNPTRGAAAKPAAGSGPRPGPRAGGAGPGGATEGDHGRAGSGASGGARAGSSGTGSSGARSGGAGRPGSGKSRGNARGKPLRRASDATIKQNAAVGHTDSGARVHGFLVGQAETLLAEILHFTGAADATTSRFFREHPKLGHSERGIIAEAVFAVLRRRTEFLHLAESGWGTPARRLILLGLMQTVGRGALTPLVSTDEAQWLERISKIDPSSLPLRVRTNLPDWIEQPLAARFAPAELARLAAALNHPAPLDLRVNTIKASRDQVLDALESTGIEAGETPFAPNGVRVAGKPPVNRLKSFEEGWFEVQDEGSQLLCHLVGAKRGEMVVDFCAGAGGKTLALGAMMRSTGRLYAFDVAERRLAKLKPRMAKSGLSNVHTVLIDSEHDPKIKRLAGKIDRVLVDSPCSGLGTLRRNPDLKWRQTPNTLVELAPKQASILASAARLVKPGGRLVYATCSILRVENEDIVEAFLEAHPDFTLVPASEVLAEQKIELDTGDYLALWPHIHATDGFFAAVMQRKARLMGKAALDEQAAQAAEAGEGGEVGEGDEAGEAEIEDIEIEELPESTGGKLDGEVDDELRLDEDGLDAESER